LRMSKQPPNDLLRNDGRQYLEVGVKLGIDQRERKKKRGWKRLLLVEGKRRKKITGEKIPPSATRKEFYSCQPWDGPE